MAYVNRSKVKLRQTLIRRASPFVFVLFLAGCQSLPFPLNGSLVNNTTQGTQATQPAAATDTAPGTTGATNSTVPASTGGVTGPVTAATKTTRVIALEKFKAARAGQTSDKMVHLWSVESKYPLKTGENRWESNYGPDGKRTTAKGSVRENYAGKTTETAWYLTATEFILVQDDEVRRQPKNQVSDQNNYDFDGLVERLLTKYSISEDSGTYYIKLTTQDEGEIKALLESLGYRKTDPDDYKGSLSLEALLEVSTGNLRGINYVYRNSLDGFADNGQITFSDWNSPIEVEDPEESPGTGTTGGTATTPQSTSTAPAASTGAPGSTSARP